MHRSRLWLLFSSALIPYLACGILVGFALLAASQVGHWPAYPRPDPKNVGLFTFNDGFGRPMRIVAWVGLPPLAVAGAGLVLGLVTAECWKQSWAPRWPTVLQAASAIGVCWFGLMQFFRYYQSLLDWLAD